MNIVYIENAMSTVSTLLMAPVLMIIVGLFFYSLYALGHFVSQHYVRKKHAIPYLRQVEEKKAQWTQGYPIHNYFTENPEASEDELEVFAIKNLEALRIVTRVAPMLGLIATMIPMGPALQALAEGNIQGISENLIIAFAAVIWGLVVSSLTFWPASVKKRWLAMEIINIRKIRAQDS